MKVLLALILVVLTGCASNTGETKVTNQSAQSAEQTEPASRTMRRGYIVCTRSERATAYVILNEYFDCKRQ